MRRMTHARRGGFTLIELLAVIGIIALLAAIGTAVFLRVRGSEEVRASEATLSKLKSGMDRRWKAVLDNVRTEMGGSKQACRIPEPGKSYLYAFAGEDHTRAQTIYAYCKLKNEFPTTIAEACNPVYIPVQNTTGGFDPFPILPPRSVFTAGFKSTGLTPGTVTGLTPTTDPEFVAKEKVRMAYESAACFQWALTATSDRGEGFDTDGTAQQTADLPYQLLFTGTDAGGNTVTRTYTGRVFKDAYSTPIAFLRQGYAAELDEKPYVQAGVVLRDSIDPTGTLVKPSGGWTAANIGTLRQQFWAKLNLTAHATLDGTAFTAQYGTYPVSNNAPRNWVPALVSAGADHRDAGFSPNLGQGDDLLSFRLAREGNRGN